MRIGYGWDSHRLQKGRPLFLGGVEIPAVKGALAHSDGDVLIHALIDAMLGAACLGDIGLHFPPSDARYCGISSLLLLQQTMDLIHDQGWGILNIDSTIRLEDPKLGPYISEIRHNLSQHLELPLERISIKAKSAEGLGPVGKKRAIEASCVLILLPRQV